MVSSALHIHHVIILLPLVMPVKSLFHKSFCMPQVMRASTTVIELCSCLAAALQDKQTAEAWAEGAASGLAAIQQYGGAKPGDRTMLDALAPAITTFRDKLSTGGASPDAQCDGRIDCSA